MSGNYIKYCILCLFLIWVSDSQSQDLKQDLNRMMDFYNNVESFSSKVRMEVFSGNNEGKVMTRVSSINKQGENFYYLMDDTELMMNAEVLIMVNNKDKQILYRKLTRDQKKALQKKYISADLDSMLMTYDSLKYHGEVGKLKHYTVYQASKMIERSELYFDKASGRIDKISYFYNQKLAGRQVYKADVYFEEVKLTPAFTENTFSVDKFLKKTGKSIQPTGAYANYRLEIIEIE